MMLTITKNIVINESDIDDIMCTALEGGITYWCNGALSIETVEWANEHGVHWLHETISRGGDIVLSTDEGDYILTLKAFLTGLQKYLNEFNESLIPCDCGYKIDTCDIDAYGADLIIQYALFGDLVYC